MQKGPIARFLVRWFVCSFGIWVAAALLSSLSYGGNIAVVIIAGLILAIINTIIKPLIVILSLPAILFSLGLFMIVINGFMVALASWLYSDLVVEGFGTAMIAGLIIGLVNYLVSVILENKK